MNDALNISYDRFIPPPTPTTNASGPSGSAWKKTATSTLTKYAGWYSVRDEAYPTTQKMNSARRPRWPSPPAPVEWTEEESYFFRLSKYGDKLLELTLTRLLYP